MSEPTRFTLPPAYPRVRTVDSFEELVATRFAGGVNALCWPRTLPGDFGAVVAGLGRRDGITPLDEDGLLALAVGAAGRAAIDVLLADLRRLRAQGLSPSLDCIAAYPRDDPAAAVPTDVYSFHADSAPVEADTFLCTYHGPPSEGLRNEEARRHVDIPATRAQIRQAFGAGDDDAFQAHLEEHCYHLHYAAGPAARPFSFGVGNLWRIAVDYPGSPVPPCIHRAPTTAPGDPPRLLLIS